MKKAQLEKFRHLLEQRRRELQESLAFDSDALQSQLSGEGWGEVHIDFNHPADMVATDPDYEKEMRLIRGEVTEVKLIDQALARIKEGTYGRCANCEEDISQRRLQAIPYTRYCVSCQSDLESRRSA